MARHNLSDAGRFGAVEVAEHGAFQLIANDSRLGNHLAVKAKRLRKRRAQPAGVLRLTHADRGTGVGRLDKHRIAVFCGEHTLRLVKMRERAARQNRIGRHFNAGGFQDGMRDRLVHTGGRGEHTAADIGKPRHLKQPLDGAVLAVLAVQHGEHSVNGDGLRPIGQKAQDSAGPAVRADKSRRDRTVLQPAVRFDIVDGTGVFEPTPVLCNAEHHNVVAVARDVAQHGSG